MVSKGNDPQMAARFRLVKYYNLDGLRWILETQGYIWLVVWNMNFLFHHMG